MGAIADPGYVGQLNACFHTLMHSIKISKGLLLLRVKKSLITPVDEAELYDGEYQNTGVVDDCDQEFVKWVPPFSP